MKTQPIATYPEVEKILIEAYRRMTLAEKRESVWRINREARRLASQTLQLRHPKADAAEIRLRVASLYLPGDLMQKAFNWTSDGQDADLDYDDFGYIAEANERAHILMAAAMKQ